MIYERKYHLSILTVVQQDYRIWTYGRTYSRWQLLLDRGMYKVFVYCFISVISVKQKRKKSRLVFLKTDVGKVTVWSFVCRLASFYVVSYAAVLRVVNQRSSRCMSTPNKGCVEDYFLSPVWYACNVFTNVVAHNFWRTQIVKHKATRKYKNGYSLLDGRPVLCRVTQVGFL